jgi:hypothetical protein
MKSNDIPKIKVGRFWKYDLTNMKFGHLKAIKEQKERSASGLIMWSCLCDCGKKTKVPTGTLVFGKSLSCGCNGKYQLVGKKFGNLTVLGESKTKNANGKYLWNCLCDCGNTTKIAMSLFKNGNTKSCGCLKINNLKGENNYQARRIIEKFGEHISSKDPWYIRASNIIDRCKLENIKTDFEGAAELAIYLRKIAPQKCPVFGVPLTTGKEIAHDFSPSVDKIIPSKGYTRGNIQIISYKANKMKQDATPKQLIQFAKWVLMQFAKMVLPKKALYH